MFEGQCIFTDLDQLTTDLFMNVNRKVDPLIRISYYTVLASHLKSDEKSDTPHRT